MAVNKRKSRKKSSTELVYDLEDNPLKDKYLESRHSLVNSKFNKKLKTLINTGPIEYGIDDSHFIKALQSKVYCKYQSELLHKYLKSPEESGLKLDLDRLTLTMKCTDDDLEHLNDKKKGFKHLRLKSLAPILVFGKGKVAGLNSAPGKGETRPHYNKTYSILVGGNKRKFFNVYSADGIKKEGRPRKSIRIDFIPDRFSDFELNLLFGHLKSVLGPIRYGQLIRNAVCTRVDVGFVMPGVFNPYVYASSSDQNVVDGKHVTGKTKGSLAETAYIGSSGKSSHAIIYDKLLKEVKGSDELLSNLSKLAVTTRIEYRFFSHRDKKIRLSDLGNTPIRLDQLEILDPLVLSVQKKASLSRILRNNKLVFVKAMKHALRKKAGQYKDLPEVSIDRHWLVKSKEKLLCRYKAILESPVKLKDSEIKANLTKTTETNIQIKEAAREIPKPRIGSKNKVDYQKQAAQAPEQNVLVVAGPGTGKTKVIVDRLKYMVDSDTSAKRIRVITFTNAAAYNVGKRIRDHLYRCDIKASTFSSWCKELLDKHLDDEYKGYKVFDAKGKTVQKDVVLEEILANLKLKKCNVDAFKKALSYRCNKQVSLKKSLSLLSPDLVSKLDKLKEVEKRYQVKKEQLKLWDFDDLLVLVLKHLKSEDNTFRKRAASNFKYLLIDEMQDTSILQWRIIKILVDNGASIFCVGDPAQSIFEFNGADWKQLNKFNNEFKNSATYPLIEHYRSTPEILKLSNWLRGKINNDYPKLGTDLPSGTKPLMEEFDDIKGVSSWIAKDIKAKYKDGAKLKEILVVVKHNETADEVHRILKSEGIQVEEIVEDNEDLRYKPLKGTAVRVITIHKAKGAERDICYVIDPRLSRFYNQESELNYLQLMYVAITRPRLKLVICKSKCGEVNYKNPNPGTINILDDLENHSDLID